jgi:hypothetical protein
MGSVHEAILKVTEEIGEFQKNLEVDDIRSNRPYNVVLFDDIVRRVQPLLVRHKLTIIREKAVGESWEREAPRATHFAKVHATYSLTGPGGDTIYAESVGESESPNDKSMAAALSFAEKYLYKDLFKLVVGDPDPDAVGGGVVDTKTAKPVASQHNVSSDVGDTSSEQLLISELGAKPVTPLTRPAAPAPTRAQPVLEHAVQGNQDTGGAEMVSDSQRMLISVILTGKKEERYPNNQGMKSDQAFDFVEGVVGHTLDRGVHYKKKFYDLTKPEAKRVMDAIKQIPGVDLPDRPRQ